METSVSEERHHSQGNSQDNKGMTSSDVSTEVTSLRMCDCSLIGGCHHVKAHGTGHNTVSRRTLTDPGAMTACDDNDDGDDDDDDDDAIFTWFSNSLQKSFWLPHVPSPSHCQQSGSIQLQFNLTANGIRLHFGQSHLEEENPSTAEDQVKQAPDESLVNDNAPSVNGECSLSNQTAEKSDKVLQMKSTSEMTAVDQDVLTAGSDTHIQDKPVKQDVDIHRDNTHAQNGSQDLQPKNDSVNTSEVELRCTKPVQCENLLVTELETRGHLQEADSTIVGKCTVRGESQLVFSLNGSQDLDTNSLDGVSQGTDHPSITEEDQSPVPGSSCTFQLDNDGFVGDGDQDHGHGHTHEMTNCAPEVAESDPCSVSGSPLNVHSIVQTVPPEVAESDPCSVSGSPLNVHSIVQTVSPEVAESDPCSVSGSPLNVHSIVQTVLGQNHFSDIDANVTVNVANIMASPDGEELRWTNVIHIPRDQVTMSEDSMTPSTDPHPGGAQHSDSDNDDTRYYHLIYYYDIWHFQMLQEKNKLYKAKLNKEEACKRQQFKILRKTHEAHLQDKQYLIENLKDIVQDQEERILQLEAQLKGSSGAYSDGGHCCNTKTLVEQVLKLQQEKSDLQLLLLNREDERNEEEIRRLREANEKLEQEKQHLQEEMIRLWSKKDSDSTDTEKQLCRKEIENDQLQEQLQDVQSNVSRLQGQMEVIKSQKEEAEANNQKLREENVRLRTELETVYSDLNKLSQQNKATEVKYEQRISELATENEKLKEQTEELKVELKQAQDKPPEVITKVEQVEVESKQWREELAKCQMALQNTELELISRKEEALTWQNNYSNVKDELEKSNHMLSSLKDVQVERDHLVKEVEELTTKCQQIEAQLTSEKRHVTDLERQVDLYKSEVASLHSHMAEEIQVLQQVKAAEIEEIKRQNEAASRDQREKLAMLQLNLLKTNKCMMEVIKEHQRLKEICLKFPEWSKIAVKELGSQVKQAIHDVSEYNVQLVKKYRKEMMLRKKYHNELVELKGNIRVFCRVRPYIKEDGSGAQAESVVSYDPDDDAIINVFHRGRIQTFELDRVFNPDSTQEEVYSEVASLVVSCIDGYNVCIFAYGQTGSGKTYTMEGPPEHPGINQRALQELFRETAERSEEWNFTITVSVIEIYNETIRDLLSDGRQEKLDIKMSPEGGLYVPGLLCYQVQSVDDVNQVFAIGQRNRATAITNMNEHSSRSHALLCVNVTGQNLTTGAHTTGRLNLVDLAGSERVSKSGAEGARLKEAQNINKSLATLGDVIHALRNKQSHIPYRNSKLTYLLHDSLGGDSKTLMIVQVAPVEKNVAETVASLAFAQRVRAVELGQATRRMDSMENSPCEENLSSSAIKTQMRQASSNSKMGRTNRK